MRWLCLALAVPLAACGSLGGGKEAPSSPTRAQLDQTVVGRPIQEVMARATRGALRTALGPEGTETVSWTQAARDKATGETVTCAETVVVRGGAVTDYKRDGNGC